jgi:hypothetical protein
MKRTNKNNPNDTQPIIDPQLLAYLEALRPTPERNPQAVQQGKARFESDVVAYLESSQSNTQIVGNQLENLIHKIKEVNIMFSQRSRIGMAIMIVFLAVFILIVGGTTATVSAARNALPGDALYRIKTGWEQTQARTAADEYERAQMYLQFAQRRLDEISALIDEGRYSNIRLAVDEFEFHIQQALESLGVLATRDPQRAHELTTQISQALSRYATILTALLSRVPDTVAGEVSRAIDISNQSLSGTPSGNENTNDNGNNNANVNENTNDSASNENLNSNDNDANMNSNTNENRNSNDDDDNKSSPPQNTNDDNSNSSSGSKGNTNTNSNTNTNNNSNSNDNDNDNNNSNSNDNDDDD